MKISYCSNNNIFVTLLRRDRDSPQGYMRFSRSFNTHVKVVVRLRKLGAVERRGPGVTQLLEEGLAVASDSLAKGSTGPDQVLGGCDLCHTHRDVGEA